MCQSVTAVIAAAGMSRRMGAFKPLLPFRGATVIEWTVRTALSWGAQRIFLVLGHRGAELARRFQAQAEVTPVFNPAYRTGDMFSSVWLGLDQAVLYGGAVFLMPGDVPAVDRRTGLRLRTELAKPGTLWVRPIWRGRGGHPVLLSPAAAIQVLRYQGPDGLRGALRSLPEPPGEIPGGPEIHMDLDTPEDYRLLRQREGEGENATVWNEAT